MGNLMVSGYRSEGGDSTMTGTSLRSEGSGECFRVGVRFG